MDQRRLVEHGNQEEARAMKGAVYARLCAVNDGRATDEGDPESLQGGPSLAPAPADDGPRFKCENKKARLSRAFLFSCWSPGQSWAGAGASDGPPCNDCWSSSSVARP